MSTLLTFINRGTLHASNNEPYVSSENDEFGYEDYPVLLSFINRGTLKASNNEPYISSENEEFGFQEYPVLLNYNYVDPNTVIIGGREYRTVVIGNQRWLAENLDYKWDGLVVGASGTSINEPRANYYNNNEATYGVNGNKYGLLYNWIAAKYLEDNKSTLLPEGWHVPTTTEWNALSNVIGEFVAGTKLKSTTGWSSVNGTDDYGFTAFPAGNYAGIFNSLGFLATFWTATSYSSSYVYLRYFDEYTTINSSYDSKSTQYSLRLVKNI